MNGILHLVSESLKPKINNIEAMVLKYMNGMQNSTHFCIKKQN